MNAMSNANAEFLYTLGDEAQLPGLFKGPFLKGRGEPRVAFVGRSNVGKSSLINALLEARLARTSHQPGKTRSIHFYLWHLARLIVADLPGYGFAQVAKTERQRWERFIEGYLKEDPNLSRILLLLDARHAPTPVDLAAMDFLFSQSIPVTFVFAKADTLKTQSEKVHRRREVQKKMQELGLDRAPTFWVSSRTQLGLGELSRYLQADRQNQVTG